MEATVVPTEVAILEVIVIERRMTRPAAPLVEIDEDVLLSTAGWLDTHTREQLIAARAAH